MNKSLCNNAYDCAPVNGDGTVGDSWSCYGSLHPCGLCLDRAKACVEFLVGEEIEWVLGTWLKKSEVDAYLMRLFGLQRASV